MPNEISVTDAHAMQQQGHTYVDVRSRPEFQQGHPEGAINVPLIDVDSDTGQMQPNPDFVRVMQAVFPPDAKLLIGCQAGGRSLRASQMLEAFGFTDVTNVRGGFGGARDPMTGRVLDQGWVDAGLPTSVEPAPGASYEELLARADAKG